MAATEASKASYRNMRVNSFQDLTTYQAAIDLQQQIYDQSKTFQKEESYSLTDQIRRSSRSVGANIAEAWAKRRYPAHFTSKLTDADGEDAETQHWLLTAHLCSLLPTPTYEALNDLSLSIGRMIGKMIAEKDRWCL